MSSRFSVFNVPTSELSFGSQLNSFSCFLSDSPRASFLPAQIYLFLFLKCLGVFSAFVTVYYIGSGPTEAWIRSQTPWNCSHRGLRDSVWLLGTELRPSGRAAEHLSSPILPETSLHHRPLVSTLCVPYPSTLSSCCLVLSSPFSSCSRVPGACSFFSSKGAHSILGQIHFPRTRTSTLWLFLF